MNIPDNFSDSLETIFWAKNIKFFDAYPNPGSGIFFTLDLGSGMEKFGSGINIPDPQHWSKTRDFLLINTAGESCVKYLSS